MRFVIGIRRRSFACAGNHWQLPRILLVLLMPGGMSALLLPPRILMILLSIILVMVLPNIQLTLLMLQSVLPLLLLLLQPVVVGRARTTATSVLLVGLMPDNDRPRRLQRIWHVAPDCARRVQGE